MNMTATKKSVASIPRMEAYESSDRGISTVGTNLSRMSVHVHNKSFKDRIHTISPKTLYAFEEYAGITAWSESAYRVTSATLGLPQRGFRRRRLTMYT